MIDLTEAGVRDYVTCPLCRRAHSLDHKECPWCSDRPGWKDVESKS